MFESARIATARAALEDALEMPVALADSAQTRAALRDAQAMADQLEAWRARLLDQLDQTGAYNDEGAPTALAWARRELRLDDKTSRRLRAAGHTMRTLPSVGEAMAEGEIRLDHVAAFTSAVRRIDHEVLVDATELILLPLAKQAPPGDLALAIDRLDKVLRPERVMKAWEDGMDKRDISLDRVGDGFHLSGFLDAELGVRLKSFLSRASAPRGQGDCESESDRDGAGDAGSDSVESSPAADSRTAAQRRADALSELLDVAAAGGIPSDRRLRPQVHVTVEADWLARQPGAAPPELEGFGPIGRELYGYLACNGDHTSVLTDGMTGGPTPYAAVLNVGRTHRLATPKQREAVRARQRGHCANPGCRHTIADVHHVRWWMRDGGPTDFENLVGLCRSCHMTVHAGRLEITRDGVGGFVFARTINTSRRGIDDRERQNRRRLVDYLRELGLVRDGARPTGLSAAALSGARATPNSIALRTTSLPTSIDAALPSEVVSPAEMPAPETYAPPSARAEAHPASEETVEDGVGGDTALADGAASEAEAGDEAALRHLRRQTQTPRT